jgi:hypothetical protein
MRHRKRVSWLRKYTENGPKRQSDIRITPNLVFTGFIDKRRLFILAQGYAVGKTDHITA